MLVEEDCDVAKPRDAGVGRIRWQLPVLECPPIGGFDAGLLGDADDGEPAPLAERSKTSAEKPEVVTGLLFAASGPPIGVRVVRGGPRFDVVVFPHPPASQRCDREREIPVGPNQLVDALPAHAEHGGDLGDTHDLGHKRKV